MKGPIPEVIPHPLPNYLGSLQLAPPAPHAPAFFDPPADGPLQHVIAQAIALVDAFSTPVTANHCYRTYAYGLAIADCAGWSGTRASALQFDKEVWFLTALLHDLGWDEEAMRETRLSFEIWGGIAARGLLRKWGAPSDVADEVCEAVIRHTEGANVTGGSVRVAGALLQLGALQDLAGIAVPHFVNPEDNAAICARWPRLGFIEVVGKLLGAEARCKPGCMNTLWLPRIQAMIQGGSACFEGLQGEAVEDEEWAAKRKGISLASVEG